MRYSKFGTAVLLAFALGPATAHAESYTNTDKFNATGVQVVTHRGSNLQFQLGVNYVDRKNRMTCTSDTGCALVIQTQFNNGNYSLGGTICTYVDRVAADPICSLSTGWNITSFQGKPALTKGDHIVHTTFTPNGPSQVAVSWQIVYTLYQH